MEMETGIVGEGGHCIRAVEVATFPARGVATGVQTLVELNIVGFTVSAAIKRINTQYQLRSQ